jgi:alpha-galactosidase
MTQPHDMIALHGTHISLVIELREAGSPLWRYWGPRLADAFESGPALLATRPTPSFSLDETVAFPVFPGFGMGWFGQSALLAHRAGQDFAFDPQRCDVDWIEPGRSVKLTLHDTVAAIAVAVNISLEPVSEMLTLSTSVTNHGAGDLDVQWLAAASLPLPDHADTVRYHGGRHNGEFALHQDRLSQSIWRRENRKGLTSHDSFPGAIIACEGATAHAGTAYGAQLAWSGNHAQTIEWVDDGRHHWQLGEWLAPGEISVAPGQSFASPDVLATCSSQGWGGVARNFHAAIRSRMNWPAGRMKPRPVHLNTWEGFYFNHDLDQIKALADASAAVGIERFVLDDGWFHKRNDDSSSLGDWWPDATKYPGGLAPLANHVTGLGMEFGLWVEPEMVNPDSDLFRAHPDWALQIAGRPLLTARNQLVLDIARPEVGDYLFDQIAALLRDLPIGYLKWDHNRDLVGAGGAKGRARYHDHQRLSSG